MTMDAVINGTIDVVDLKCKIDIRVALSESDLHRVVPTLGVPFHRELIEVPSHQLSARTSGASWELLY